MKSGHWSGLALAAGSIVGVAIMTVHPSHIDMDATADELRRLALHTRAVHGGALAASALTLFGLADVSRRMGLARAPVLAGLVFYALGAMAVISAAVMSGFVAGDAIEAAAGMTGAARELPAQQLHYTHWLNQGYAAVFVAASCAGILCWSAALWSMGRLRGLAVVGVLAGLGGVAALFAGPAVISVHGFLLLVLSQAIWTLTLGVTLLRKPDWPG